MNVLAEFKFGTSPTACEAPRSPILSNKTTFPPLEFWEVVCETPRKPEFRGIKLAKIEFGESIWFRTKFPDCCVITSALLVTLCATVGKRSLGPNKIWSAPKFCGTFVKGPIGTDTWGPNKIWSAPKFCGTFRKRPEFWEPNKLEF
uniref:Uncharacterized protein n=1 Tax=Cacopsylla melanoneura TaxID=428564 RepID=A0A8D9FA41_9HEMI